MNKNILIAIACFCFSLTTTGQSNVGIGTPVPDPTALLDLTANDKGFLAPRMTTTDRLAIINPAQGLTIFDITVGCYFYYNAGWVSLCQLSGPTGATGTGISNVVDNGNGTFTFNFTDSTSFTTSNVTGPTGTAGISGTTGPTGPGSICAGATTDYVAKFLSATNICNSIIYDNGTNVGIGTTAPANTLHIIGSEKIQQTNANFLFNADNLSLDYSAAGTVFPYIEWRDNAASRGAYLGAGLSGNHLDFVFENNNNLAIHGGDVSIGIIPPAYIFPLSIWTNGGNEQVSINNQNAAGSSGIEFAINNGPTNAALYPSGGIWDMGTDNTSGPVGPPPGYLLNQFYIRLRVGANSFLNALTIQHTGDPNSNYATHTGINTNDPAYELTVFGDAGKTQGGSLWTVISDERLKKNVEPFTQGIDVLRKIDPVKFRYNGKGGIPESKKDEIGVIAQDIQKIAPYMISTFKHADGSDNTEYLSYNGNALLYIMVNSIKEQQQQIEKLESELLTVKTKLYQIQPVEKK